MYFILQESILDIKFIPSNDKYKEIFRARMKNENLYPIGYMYMGPRKSNKLSDLLTGADAFIENPYTGEMTWNLQFDHIRQIDNTSVDKSQNFGDFFSDCRLIDNPEKLFEFVACQPLSEHTHKCKGMAAANGFTLKDVKKRTWILQSKENYAHFCVKFEMDWPPYDQVIKWLSDIDYPPIGELYAKNI